MYEVVTIGSATRDNFLKGNYPLIDSKESSSGKAYALPYGEKLGVDSVHFTIGGNAANASVTFARQGFKTACAAKIGGDLPAKEFLAPLKGDGVSAKLIIQTDEKPTAYSVLLLGGNIASDSPESDKYHHLDFKFLNFKSRWWYL